MPDHAAVAAELDALLARAGTRARGPRDPRPPPPASCWPRGRRSPIRAAGSRPGARRLDGAAASLRRLPALRLERETGRLRNAHDRLRLLGPGATLERGYAIVQDDAGAVVRDAAAVAVGAHVGVRLAAGRLGARVEEVGE